MPRIWTPQRSTKRFKPPIGAEIDWSHPLAVGLHRFWVVENGVPRDLTRKAFTALAFSGAPGRPIPVSSPYGDALEFVEENSQYVTMEARAIFLQIATPGISALSLNYPASGGSSAVYTASFGKGANRPFQLRILRGASTWTPDAGFRTNTATAYATDATAYPYDQWYHYGMTWAPTDLYVRGYVNGIARGATSLAGTLPNDGTYNTSLGYTNAGSTWQGRIAYGAIWIRLLKSADFAELWEEPWAMLYVPKRRTCFVVTGEPPAQSQAPRSMHQFRLRRA